MIKEAKNKPKERSGRWTIRLHCNGLGRKGWLYLLDGKAGWTPAVHFAMQYPFEEIAAKEMPHIMRALGVRKKSLDEYELEEIPFDIIETYEVPAYCVNPKLFWELLGEGNYKTYLKMKDELTPMAQKLKETWDERRYEPGENVTYEVAMARVGSHQWEVEKAITKPFKKRDHDSNKRKREEIEAVYKSRKIPIGKGVTLDVATRRYLNKDWTLREAINVPKGQMRPSKKERVE